MITKKRRLGIRSASVLALGEVTEAAAHLLQDDRFGYAEKSFISSFSFRFFLDSNHLSPAPPSFPISTTVCGLFPKFGISVTEPSFSITEGRGGHQWSSKFTLTLPNLSKYAWFVPWSGKRLSNFKSRYLQTYMATWVVSDHRDRNRLIYEKSCHLQQPTNYTPDWVMSVWLVIVWL